MLLSRVKYLFTSRSSFYPNQNFKWENFFFIKTYIHVIGKSFCHEKKNFKKRKKIKRNFPKTTIYDKKKKPIFI